MKKIGGFLFEVVLREHLAHNHFPPISSIFVPSALEAIEKADSGDTESLIELLNGLSLPVSQIIEELHLEDFLGIEEGENSAESEEAV